MPTVRERDILLRLRGDGRWGSVFRRGSYDFLEREKYIFARADGSTCATYIDRSGVVRVAAAGVPRIEWLDLNNDGIRETPGLLIEGTRTNGWVRSEELDNAAWTKNNCTISANASGAPDGTTTADHFIESTDGSPQIHFVNQTWPSVTDNTWMCASCFVRAGTRPYLLIQTRNKANAFYDASFNLNGGAFGGSITQVTSGAFAWMIPVAMDGLVGYRCILVCPAGSGATTMLTGFYPATGSGAAAATYQGNGGASLAMWGFQCEASQAFPSSYIKTVSATVTRASDSFTLPFGFGPVDKTVLLKFARPYWADVTGDLGFFPTLLNMGGVNDPNARIEIAGQQTTRNYQARFGTAASQAAAAIPAGAEQKFIVQCKNALTLPAVAVDVGSGPTAFDTGAPAFSQYVNQTLEISHPSVKAFVTFTDILLAQGLFSYAEMLAA